MSDIILSAQNGQAVVSSLDIAEKFEKRHDHVMRDIEDIMKGLPKNGDTPMFFKTEYVHPQNGQTYPMYLMNRDGFTLLVMGFNKSAKAMEWKLKYIQAFNEMEKKLTTPEPEPPELALSKALVIAQGIIAREQDRSKQLEKENAKLKPAAEYAHNMLLSDETLTVTQIALNFGMTANKLNKLLEEWGIQKKVNKQWIPKRKYIDKGYTVSMHHASSSCSKCVFLRSFLVSFFHCDLSQLVNVFLHRRAEERSWGHAPGKVPLAVEVLPDPRRFASVALLCKDARAKLNVDAVKEI